MKHHFFSKTVSVLLTVLFGVALLSCQQQQSQPGEEGEKSVTATEVPQAVLDAFHAAYPDANVHEYSEEREDGQLKYEISFEYESTRYDASYNAAGEVVELEKTIAADLLPAAIREALTANYGEMEIRLAEQVNKSGNVFYEVKLTDPRDGKRYEILFGEDGRLVESEEDEE